MRSQILELWMKWVKERETIKIVLRSMGCSQLRRVIAVVEHEDTYIP